MSKVSALAALALVLGLAAPAFAEGMCGGYDGLRTVSTESTVTLADGTVVVVKPQTGG